MNLLLYMAPVVLLSLVPTTIILEPGALLSMRELAQQHRCASQTPTCMHNHRPCLGPGREEALSESPVGAPAMQGVLATPMAVAVLNPSPHRLPIMFWIAWNPRLAGRLDQSSPHN